LQFGIEGCFLRLLDTYGTILNLGEACFLDYY